MAKLTNKLIEELKNTKSERFVSSVNAVLLEEEASYFDQKGEKGDYLLINDRNEVTIISAEEFEKNFTRADFKH